MVELMVVVVCYYHTVAPTGLDGFILCFYYYHTVAPTGLDGFILCFYHTVAPTGLVLALGS